MNGAKILSALGMGPLGDRMGLFLAVTSYNGKLSINATSCRRTMPDIEFFIDCLKDSFAELLSAENKLHKKKSTNEKAKKTTKKTTRSKKVANKPQAKQKTTSIKKASLPANRKKRAKKVVKKKANKVSAKTS
jgi:hypothetical protein